MFGRVVINKGNLKCKEFDLYKAHYCGICRALKNHGFLSSFFLSYDMVFLEMLLNSLYDSQIKSQQCRCACHICKKHTQMQGIYTSYAADMTILLSYFKCLDDLKDDKNPLALLSSLYLKPKYKKVAQKYPEKCAVAKSCIEELSQKESSSSLEDPANIFGRLLGEIFIPNDDIWKDLLFNMGFYLGKYIYIADAFEDLEDDIRKKRHNPLIAMSDMHNFTDEINILLNMMASECADNFEQLPIIDNAEILRNIIYSGIWQSMNKKKGNKT